MLFYLEMQEREKKQHVKSTERMNGWCNKNKNGYCFIKNNHVKNVIHFGNLRWIHGSMDQVVCILARGRMVNNNSSPFLLLHISKFYYYLLLLDV